MKKITLLSFLLAGCAGTRAQGYLDAQDALLNNKPKSPYLLGVLTAVQEDLYVKGMATQLAEAEKAVKAALTPPAPAAKGAP